MSIPYPPVKGVGMLLPVLQSVSSFSSTSYFGGAGAAELVVPVRDWITFTNAPAIATMTPVYFPGMS